MARCPTNDGCDQFGVGRIVVLADIEPLVVVAGDIERVLAVGGDLDVVLQPGALLLQRAQALLNQHTVTSPIDGIVVERFRSQGEFASDGPIVQLAQLDPLNVEVLLPASRFGLIKPGMQATVMPEAPLEGSYTAEVKIVDRVVDASSGMFGVRLELPNPDNKLPGGLRCTVSFADSVNRLRSGAKPGQGKARVVRAAK